MTLRPRLHVGSSVPSTKPSARTLTINKYTLARAARRKRVTRNPSDRATYDAGSSLLLFYTLSFSSSSKLYNHCFFVRTFVAQTASYGGCDWDRPITEEELRQRRCLSAGKEKRKYCSSHLRRIVSEFAIECNSCLSVGEKSIGRRNCIEEKVIRERMEEAEETRSWRGVLHCCSASGSRPLNDSEKMGLQSRNRPLR